VAMSFAGHHLTRGKTTVKVRLPARKERHTYKVAAAGGAA